MKKGFLIFLCSLYLFAVSGAKVAVHYCHGHFQTITLNGNPDEDVCCKKRPMKKHGCCNDKVVEIKIKSDQKVTISTIQTFNSNANFTALHQIITLFRLYSIDDRAISPLAHAPPRAETVSVLIMNGTFRI